jgi:hypothetical protein
MFTTGLFGGCGQLWAAPTVAERRNLPQFFASRFRCRNLSQMVVIRRNSSNRIF